MNNKNMNKIICLYGGNDDKIIYTQSILDKYKNTNKLSKKSLGLKIIESKKNNIKNIN